MNIFSAPRLVLLIAVLIASTAVVAAQSGRRGKAKSSGPPTPPVASGPTEAPSKPKTSSRIQMLVAVDHPTGFDGVPYRVPDVVLEACLRRIAESKDVTATPAFQQMTRSEVLKAAKAETIRYVVWLQVRNERADYSADVSYGDHLYVTFTIYEPGTAKIKDSGRADYATAKVGNVGVSGPSARRAVYSDYAIKETAKQAADKILNAFQIKIDSWPR